MLDSLTLQASYSLHWLVSLIGRASARLAEDVGSIPARGEFFLVLFIPFHFRAISLYKLEALDSTRVLTQTLLKLD